MIAAVYQGAVENIRDGWKDVKLMTPFNIITAIILLTWVPLVAYRFIYGCGAVSAVDDTNPWGVFIGFNVCCGVALSAGGFTIGSAVYLFGMKEYHHIVRQAVFTGFLGYLQVPVALMLDLGQPWRLPYPYFVSFGFTSVMFLVAWHVGFYLTTQFVEFTPAVFEFLKWKKFRKWAVAIATGATVFGGVLTTLHQSALGALFLLAPSKIHPLWYSSYLPMFYLVSAIGGGIAVVICVDWIGRKTMWERFAPERRELYDRLIKGLAKAASIVLFIYLGFKVAGIAIGDNWMLLGTGWGLWFLVEMLGFVALPCFMFAVGSRDFNIKLIRWAAVITVLGIVLNRMNTASIAFNWWLPWDEKYIPMAIEVWMSLGLVVLFMVIFRWAATFLHVFRDDPNFEESH